MNIDTTIYGYVGDGFICCCSCAETIAKEAHEEQLAADDIPAEDGDYTPTHEDYELAGLSALGAYSGLHDRPCGETCDCGTIIVEEDDEHGLGPDGCLDCGYTVPALWAAVTPRRTVLGRFQTEGEAEDYLWEYNNRLTSEGLPPLDGTIVELAYDDPTGPGGRLPIPGEVPLFPQPAAFIEAQFEAAIEVDHLTVEQLAEVAGILDRAGY
jgi:hypothetical protein